MRAGMLVVALAACGRVGFDDRAISDATDAPAIPADAAPCQGTAQQVSIDPGGAGTWVTSISGIATSTGLALTYVAPDGVALGLTYTVNGTSLAVRQVDTQLVSGIQSATNAVPVGAQFVVAASSAAGTIVRTFDDQVNPTNVGVMRNTRFAVTGPLAVHGGATVYLDNDTTPTVQGRVLNSMNGDQTSPMQLLAASVNASDVTIQDHPSGFLLTWVSSNAQVQAEVLDPSFTPVVMPTTIRTASLTSARAAYATLQHRILFVWVDSSSLDTWMQLTDEQLNAKGAATRLHAGTRPRVASDGNSFWVVWHDTGAPALLGGAHVTATGTVQTFTVTGTGGTEIDHDLVERGGSVSLLWFEQGGTALWSVPACLLGT